ncbi:hypothetical protein PCC9214_04968 [Planktothrix tepida]|uniref:DUF3611 family protein n=1 Tax=Planktothrix tepida PCC 9214 TaxID=671072 RepID=A0A1J1LT44_9CYAN|nr:DUF3611 family protein [Planktothrix tepida]CAD5982399.1 hypothetical protein PCC9214_04968 [Planktothrix tepida]CUR35779.1 conserved membrane hypothetical protein [Planktothrix tepida PCC 9214]
MVEPYTNYESPSPNVNEIAQDFRRLGWFGFWVQSILGIIPIFLLIFVLFLRPASPSNPQNSALGLVLGYGCLFALIFTLYWCFRYSQIGNQLEDPNQRPAKAEVIHALWLGITANLIGMACVILVGFLMVGSLLYRMLTLPPGGSKLLTPLPGTTVLNAGSIITPFNLIAMQAMVNAMAAELAGIAVSLWLLSRVSSHQPK